MMISRTKKTKYPNPQLLSGSAVGPGEFQWALSSGTSSMELLITVGADHS